MSKQKALKTFQENLSFMQGRAPDLYSFLQKNNDSGNINVSESNQNIIRVSIEVDGNIIVDDLVKEANATLENQIIKPKRVICSRVTSADNAHELKISEAAEYLSKSIDSNESFLLNSLPCISQSIYKVDKEDTFLAQDSILIGSLALYSLPSILEKNNLSTVTILENNPLQFSALLHVISLENLISLCKHKGVSLSLILDTNSSYLLDRLKSSLCSTLFMAIYGFQIYLSPAINSELESIYSWLLAEDGFFQFTRGILGSETDEVNQTLHSVVNATSEINRFRLIRNQNKLNKPILIVASGPSVDENIESISKNADNFYVLTAGSSLGTLLRNNIRVDFAVLLEMSSDIFRDMCELVSEGYDLSKINLIASITIDPRIPCLFGNYISFHRPFSTASTLFPEELSSALPISGPQAINAAYESALYMNPPYVILAGCDLSAPINSIERSTKAVGISPRPFDIPVAGNKGRTLVTDAELISTKEALEISLNLSDFKTYRIGEGIKIENNKLSDVISFEEIFLNVNETPESNNSNIDLKFIASLAIKCDNKLDQISNIIEKAKINLKGKTDILSNLINSESSWNAKLMKSAGISVSLLDGDQLPEQRLINRLYRFPLYFALQAIHDADTEKYADIRVRTIFSLKYIEEFYLSYMNLLEKLLNLKKRPPYDPLYIRRLVSSSAEND